MRRLVGLTTAALFITLAPSACSAANSESARSVDDRPPPTARVATVHGLAIVVGEVERELRRSRGTGSPDQVADKALERVVEIKVQQAMMLPEGIIETADYSSYLDALAQENGRREAALREGQAVYGPTKLEPDYYFGYRFDTEVLALKERLQGSELHTDDADLRAYYESVKEVLFRRGARTTADVLAFPRTAEDAEQRAREAERRLRAGEGVAAVARSLDVVARRETIEPPTSRVQVDRLTAASSDLRAGEISRVLDSSEAFVVIRCVAKKDLGFTSFEENKERIRAFLLDQKYEELVQRHVRQADVDIDRDVLDRIPVQ